jgi:molybdate transport system substrate-binding protein
MDELVQRGKVQGQSRTEIARTAAALGAGAPKPNLTTLDSTKAALLNAKSIAYSDPALAGSCSGSVLRNNKTISTA